MLGRSSTRTSFRRRVNANMDVYAPARIKKFVKESGISANAPIRRLNVLEEKKKESPDVQAGGSSSNVEKRVVFVFSLNSTISKSISRASTRRVVVFPEPAGPVRTSNRCTLSHHRHHFVKVSNSRKTNGRTNAVFRASFIIKCIH